MSRRLSSHEASEATVAEPQRGRGSRCSLGCPNSSLSPWYTSSRNGVSLSSMTITSPCQPLSVSGSVSGISYPTSVSSSIIPRTQTRLISASASGGGRLIRGGGADSMPRICRPLRVGADTAITGNEELFQLSVRVVPSHGRLAQSRSSSCGGGHAFLRHTSRISVRVGPRTSNPVVAERMRIADSLRRQASAGRRGANRPLFVPAEASESAERAEQQSTSPPSAARTIEFKHLDATPRVFTSIQEDATRPLGVKPARSISSPEEVGRALFSDWANRKEEMFADVFKGRKSFFADLLKLRHDEGRQPTARAQKVPTADSSRSEPFMTTISEMVEKDVPDTSAENDTVHSTIGPTNTARMTAIEEKAPLQAVTASKKLYLTSSEFDSYDLSRTADSITQARGALSDGVSKETLQDKAESRGEKLPECMSFDSQLKETETAPEVPRRDQGGFEEVKGTSVDLLIPKAESEDKMEVPLELVPSEQQLQDTKAMKVTQVSSLWSVEAASARAEVPTEASGYGYVPALVESTFEAPGATSDEHQVMPTSFEGPFASMASDMTDFPVLELSKTQEPDVSRQLPSLREPDHSEVQTQLVERPKMDDSAQLQVADTYHQFEASGARHPSRECDKLLPLESTATVEQVVTEEAFEKHGDIQLKGETTVDVAEEHSLSREPQKESEVRDVVPRQVDQGSELISSESYVAVDLTTAEQHDNIPLVESTKKPTDEEYLAKQERGNKTLDIVARYPEQESEIISSEQVPLSDVNVALQHDYIMPQTRIESSAVVEVKETEKHEGVPFAELATEPTDEEFLGRREPGKKTWYIIPRPPQQGEIVSTEPTPLSDVSATQQLDGVQLQQSGAPAADENLTQRETAKESELTDMVPRPEDQGGGFVLSERNEVVGVSAREKSDIAEPIEDDVATATDEYSAGKEKLEVRDLVLSEPDRTYKSLSSERSTVADIAALVEREDIKLVQPSAASDIGGYILARQEEKTSDGSDLVARDKERSSELVSSYPIAVVEASTIDRYKGQQLETSMVPIPLEEIDGTTSSTSLEPADAATMKDLDRRPLTEPDNIPSADDYSLTKQTEKVSEVQDIVARQPDESSDLVPSEDTQVAGMKEEEQRDESQPSWQITEYAFSRELKEGAAMDVVTKEPQKEEDIAHSIIVPSTLETSQSFPAIEYLSTRVAETSEQVTASTAARLEQALMTKGDEYPADASAEAVLQEKEQPAAEGPVDYGAQFWDMDYAAQFWDSEAIKLQLTNMWTPEGGAVVVEDIQADIMVPERVAALSDQYSVATTQPTRSWASPSKEVPGDTLAPLQFDELPDSPVEEILLEPGYFKHVVGAEVLEGLELRPQDREEAPTEVQAESGDIEALPDERPITSGQEGGMFHMESEGGKAADAPFGGVVAVSADMGAQPQPALPTLVEHLEYPGREEEVIEEHAESAVAEVLPAGRPTAISGQEDALGLEFPSRETTGEPIANAEEEMIAPVNVLPDLTWSVTSDRPTEHPEREPEATEETTAAAEPDFTVQQPKKVEEIKRTASDLVGDKFDSAANEERGPLLSIKRMEKHSCEKTSERILKRYGDTKPMESVTEAHESFVIAETETQFFGAETRESIMRNAPEKARAEAECSQSKFEPDVFLSDLIGKNGIEPTEPSQPCDYIARPLNIFDDVVGAAATSTTEAVSWKQSPSEDVVIKTESEGTKESGPYCREKEAVDYDNASDHINRVDEVSEGTSSKSPSDPFSSPKSSPLATFSPFPEAEFTSLTNQGQYVPRPTFDLESNRGTNLLACTKESDFTIRTVGDSECQSSLSAESNSSLDANVLRKLHKPPLRLSGGGFQQQLVNVNALSVPLGKRAFPGGMLPYSVYKNPFHSVSSASELDSTKDKDFCQKTGEIPENIFAAPSAKPTGEVPADATYVSLTESNVNILPLADESEQLPNCEATLNENEPGFQLDAAAYQQELPEVEDIAVSEAQGQYVHSEAVSSAQLHGLKTSFPAF
ncbi:hypothetical protein HPB49_018139 [Dermacentor silvarum]|uniref:Uncharacterized protein n=1 Tax=Dermacentor silvarum TaxID=543639 RepID=A0ACB8DEW4_DERSI|nr:hypothetical protein HPB49_018139 [Dermacentor silvarum]